MLIHHQVHAVRARGEYVVLKRRRSICACACACVRVRARACACAHVRLCVRDPRAPAANAAGELLASTLEKQAPPTAYEYAAASQRPPSALTQRVCDGAPTPSGTLRYGSTFDPERWTDGEYVKRVTEGQAGRGLQI